MSYENIKPNRTQALGLFFLVISIFSYVGGWAWVMAYWDYEYKTTYRGYDVYYFPEINFYGIDTGGEYTDWPYVSGTLLKVKLRIDSWLDDPLQVESYRDFILYEVTALGKYYGEGLGVETLQCNNLTSLRNYIDDMYYPTKVRSSHRDGDTWTIYRQGRETSLRYWVDFNGEVLQEFETLGGAEAYLKQLVEDAEETQLNPDTPGTLPDEPATGIDTLGDYLDSRKIVISAVSGGLGSGLVLIGSVKREEE